MSYSPEVTLWRAVIAQAFLDASSTAHSTRDRLEKDEARKFLLNPSPGLAAICDVAGVDPAHVNREATRRKTAGWPMKRTARGKQGVLE